MNSVLGEKKRLWNVISFALGGHEDILDTSLTYAKKKHHHPQEKTLFQDIMG